MSYGSYNDDVDLLTSLVNKEEAYPLYYKQKLYYPQTYSEKGTRHSIQIGNINF